MPDVTVATRASALARAQTAWVRRRIEDRTGLRAHEVLVTSQGDVSNAALTSFGGQGVFVVAIREALFDGRADIAVHSMKDLPTAPDPDTAIAAVPPREDPRDYIVCDAAGLEDLPARARVATGSPRRAAYLLRARPDLQIVDIRGNVESRIAKVSNSDVDAVVVAVAGLRRLGLQPPGFIVDPSLMLPAVGQGALAVQTRADHPLAELISEIDDPVARAEVTAERSLLAGLRAGCSAPVGAQAAVDGEVLTLRAAVLSTDGSQMYECTITDSSSQAQDAGRRAAENLIGQGADRLLGENR